MHFDVVIVGAGLGGLTSGLYLAKQGKKVAIVEKHRIPGGYATNFKRKGKNGVWYEFDVSLHGIGNLSSDGMLAHIFKELGLQDKVNFLRKSETATVQTKVEEYDLLDDAKRYEAELKKAFPAHEKGIEALFSFLKDLDEDMLQVGKSNVPPKYFDQLSRMTLDDWIRKYVDDDKFVEVFSTLWLYYGLPPKQLSALYFCLGWIGYHMHGTYYVESGSQKLSDAYVTAFKDHGGQLFLGQEVEHIQIEADEMKKVITKKGEQFSADVFILNGDPNHLFTCIENPNAYSQAFVEKMAPLEVGVSLSQLYIGLDCLPEEIGLHKADYFCMAYGHDQTWASIQEGNYEKMDFCITNGNVKDPNLNPSHGALAITIGDLARNWPERGTEAYKEQKVRVIDTLINRATECFPNLKSHIVVAELGTPRTMQRYTNNREGAVYGWSQSVSQAGFDRLSVQTTLQNVYLASSWTQPGGGFEGAITGGFTTGKLVHRRKKGTTETAKTSTTVSKENIDLFLLGMCSGLNPSVAANQMLMYQFIFDEKHTYFIEVKNQKATVFQTEDHLKTDAIIHVPFHIWQKISFGEMEGADAFQAGQLKVEGDFEAFMQVPKLFGTVDAKEENIAKTKMNVDWLIGCTLIPWIVFWSASHWLSPSVIGGFGLVFVLFVIFVLKPKSFHQVTILEGATLLAFGLYGILPLTAFQLNAFMNGVLILAWGGSALLGRPITAQYSRYKFPDFAVRSTLFRKINQQITYVWAAVFAIQFVVTSIFPFPMNQWVYFLCAFALLFTILYPKKKLKI